MAMKKKNISANKNMQDINLFSQYEAEKPKTRYDALIVLFLAVLVIGGIVWLELGINSELGDLDADLEQKNAYIESKEVKEAMQRISDKKVIIANLENLENSLSSMDSILRIKGIVHVGLFNELNLSVPEFVYIRDLSMNQDTINITGYADSYKSVGEFEHNIRNNARFSAVSVPSISNEGGNYSFSMMIVLNMEV